MLDELMRAFLFVGMLLWFAVLMCKYKAGLSAEFANLKRDFDQNSPVRVLDFYC